MFPYQQQQILQAPTIDYSNYAHMPAVVLRPFRPVSPRFLSWVDSPFTNELNCVHFTFQDLPLHVNPAYCPEIREVVEHHPPLKKTFGPRGANLFVMFLPKHYNEDDMLMMFSPFGNILSIT